MNTQGGGTPRSSNHLPWNKSVMASGGKNIAQIVSLQKPKAKTMDPPITRHIRLPQIVSVRYIAEILAKEVFASPQGMFGLARAVSHVCRQLRIAADRSVSFQQAAWLLRKYGIDSELEG